MSLAQEIAMRRTFAIISHPDAGKTTMTEKLLLYGGAVQLAGSVTARKNQRASTSDWMELERQRGISISSTALQFDYDGYHINLLDTPGHKDFSEDTYRVLTAVDAVVMIIDAAKGIESQTRKLFEVCHQRGVPIFTFMNKCDRPTRDPLELVDELENVLQLSACPINWPIGTGADFKGVYDRLAHQVHLFERTVGGIFRAPVAIGSLADEVIRQRIDDDMFHRVSEELAMLDHAGTTFDPEAVLTGYTTPVFFGSAANNFGVQLLLDGFLKHAPAPCARKMGDRTIEPDAADFSGFIFKIQANMDPRHRDRIAFLRVISGKFERDMLATHSRSGQQVRLSSSHKLFANEREIVNEAYAGDIIGLVGHAEFCIGDTLTTDPSIIYREIPRFRPEAFATLVNPSTAKYKQFRKGLDQLLQEGVVQRLRLKDAVTGSPLLAAVGPLQFEVVQYRLQSEYGAETRLEPAPWNVIRWLPPAIKAEELDRLTLPAGARVAFDADENPCVLFTSEWSVGYFTEINATTPLEKLPPERVVLNAVE